MSEAYQEILAGQTLVRKAPGIRHELICRRLHQTVQASVANFSGTRLLSARSRIQISQHTVVCPDLAVVTAQTGKVWLVAEIVDSADHKPDTVLKKQIYEDARLPRLWMVDPRYNNVEIYHSTEYGLSLRQILAGNDVLTEKLLPEFQISVVELFAEPTPGPSRPPANG
jgi:Uma2 family endonuclease